MWTSAVFSLTPVKADALESRSSFMMMVVLMHMNMLYEYAYVKAASLMGAVCHGVPLEAHVRTILSGNLLGLLQSLETIS